MLRTFMQRAVRSLLPAALLAGAVTLPLESGAAQAAGPRLTLRCFDTKIRYQISCWTWGNSFAAGEWVHLKYDITYITMPKVNGHRPGATYKRTVKTNGIGTFTRTPRVTFMTNKTHTTYRIAVTAVGAQKDTGTTSLAAIGT